MKILVTGNLGYVGPVVVSQLRAFFPDACIIGYDMGYFETGAAARGPSAEDRQYIADVREFPEGLLEGVDAVVHLAAISNDPMGSRFERVTMEINYRATAALAEKAKRRGVSSFVFASSCSVYGFSEQGLVTEQSEVNPLSAYARSKVLSETAIRDLAGNGFKATCLRFATACGWSERLRLDLVLNEFVAGALSTGQIRILSDGTPWRPLIHVRDMGRAIAWAVARPVRDGGEYLAVNTGSNAWNHQVVDLAAAVADAIPHTQVCVNETAAPDRRSYRVNFGLFETLAAGHQPEYDLRRAILELRDGLISSGFNNRPVDGASFIRLKRLESLIRDKAITEDLKWA